MDPYTTSKNGRTQSSIMRWGFKNNIIRSRVPYNSRIGQGTIGQGTIEGITGGERREHLLLYCMIWSSRHRGEGLSAVRYKWVKLPSKPFTGGRSSKSKITGARSLPQWYYKYHAALRVFKQFLASTMHERCNKGISTQQQEVSLEYPLPATVPVT